MVLRRYSWGVLVSILGLAFTAHAQLSVTAPGVNAKVKSCDDYAAQELNNPWDMSDSADINNYFLNVDVLGFSNAAFGSGIFSATATTAGSNLYLLSPYACGGYPVGGRYGVNHPINVSKYDKLSYRMYTDTVDPFGMRLIWDRSCNYAGQRTVTTPAATKVGWHTYTIDLQSLTADAGASTDVTAWSGGNINGLAFLPTTQTGSNIALDWIMLEDSSSCGSYNVQYTANTQGSNNLASVWLDDDTNPFNGYLKQITTAATAAGAASVSISSLGLFPGNYQVIGLLDSDYRTLEATDPWDMSESTDVLVTANISSGSFSSGVFSGTAASTEPNIYLTLNSGGLDASKYTKLTVKLTRSDTSTPVRLFWSGTSGGGAAFGEANNVGGGVYQFDLSGEGAWTGTVSSLVLRPGEAPGMTFSLDFVSLRASGYDMTRAATTLAGSIVAGAGTLNVNRPPLITIEKPDHKGGEALKPWNMRSTQDFQTYVNLDPDDDASHSGEKNTTFLPDVRVVEGLRGDFFKGTNVDGSDDPTNYSTIHVGSPQIQFSATDYKNACFKLFVDKDFDLTNGSVGRILWRDTATTNFTSEDLPLIYDGWSGSQWYEYCVDMTEVWIDGTTSPNWSGIMDNFRVDAHEFSTSTQYYFDYIKLRKDDTSHGVYTIVYQLVDEDDAATVSFYYSSNNAPSGGTLITTLSESTRSYAWDTTGIPAGTYYVYAVANDGYNTVTRMGTGRIVIDNSGATGSDPVLSLETPTAGGTVCGTLQVKGYALQPDRFEDVSAVEVSVDGTLKGLIRPSLYSLNAVAAYPEMDSSNSGFDTSYDISGLTDGAHTVTVKAISSTGASTTQTIAVTKAGSGCPSTITDPSPAATPLPAEGLMERAPAPRISKATHDAKGNVTIVLASLGSTACTHTLYAGSSSSAVTTMIKSYTPSAANVAKNKITLTGKGVKIKKSSLPASYFKVQKSCPGFTDSFSSVKTMKTKTKSGSIATVNALANKLKKLRKK